MTTIRQVKS